MEVVSDALNQDARRLLKALLVNVLNMVVANDVPNLDAQRVPKARQINA
jgi:hypothetical protein